MNAATMTIVPTTAPTGEERFDATFHIVGHVYESIEGLYDVASCLAWLDMTLSYHAGKYTRCSCR